MRDVCFCRLLLARLRFGSVSLLLSLSVLLLSEHFSVNLFSSLNCEEAIPGHGSVRSPKSCLSFLTTSIVASLDLFDLLWTWGTKVFRRKLSTASSESRSSRTLMRFREKEMRMEFETRLRRGSDLGGILGLLERGSEEEEESSVRLRLLS